MKKTITSTAILLIIILAGASAEARQPRRGYRGFFEWSNDLRRQDFGYWDLHGNLYFYRETIFYTGFSTSHGYQINPMFFIGAGLSIEGSTNENLDSWIAPVFIQGRADFKFGKFTPFGDIRVGFNFAEGSGIYFAPSIGYRFNWGRKTGINIGAGLTLSGYRSEHYEGTFTGPDSFEIQYIGTRSHVRPHFSFRVGIDF